MSYPRYVVRSYWNPPTHFWFVWDRTQKSEVVSRSTDIMRVRRQCQKLNEENDAPQS